jgi:antitoxin component of MazEF toxin-antitoxin module|tara:strand:+ start:770 stop:976 length:207 start_codon:yes stop_codon:yes gene_type:complete
MIELKILAVGKGLGVELPREVLEQLGAIEGETIFLEHMCNASYRLAKHDDKFVEQIILIDGQMHEEDS